MGGTTSLPLAGFPAASTLEIVGQVLAEGERGPTANRRYVLPGYFETMGIPLLTGRTLAETDRSDSEPVAVVSESLARIAWPEQVSSASPPGAQRGARGRWGFGWRSEPGERA